jgi:hypothetical protein
VEEPECHDFQRMFAFAMLRNGTNIFKIAKLMGHEGIIVLQRYLEQTNLDTKEAHHLAGPVGNSEMELLRQDNLQYYEALIVHLSTEYSSFLNFKYKKKYQQNKHKQK